jgi:nitroreductase
MNYIVEAIKSRRSIRSYSDQEVPKKLLEEIIDAGRSAPSALNTQPWRFVVVTDRKIIRELSYAVRRVIKRIYSIFPILRFFMKEFRDDAIAGAVRKTATSDEDTVFYNAPALILIVSEKKGRWVGVNCALAAENMILAAHSLGIGSCFIGRGDVLAKCRPLLKKIGVDKEYKVYASVIFGYPKEFPKDVRERRKDNIISWK